MKHSLFQTLILALLVIVPFSCSDDNKDVPTLPSSVDRILTVDEFSNNVCNRTWILKDATCVLSDGYSVPAWEVMPIGSSEPILDAVCFSEGRAKVYYTNQYKVPEVDEPKYCVREAMYSYNEENGDIYLYPTAQNDEIFLFRLLNRADGTFMVHRSLGSLPKDLQSFPDCNYADLDEESFISETLVEASSEQMEKLGQYTIL